MLCQANLPKWLRINIIIDEEFFNDLILYSLALYNYLLSRPTYT
jgi:hypothetical protein